MKTTVAQSALHRLPCKKKKKKKKQRRPIPRRQEGIGSWEDLDFPIDYRDEMAICTKIWNTTYDGRPGVLNGNFITIEVK